MATLDAAVRMVQSLIDARGLDAGAEAGQVVTRLMAQIHGDPTPIGSDSKSVLVGTASR